jgi:PAS domain-containing protein
MARSYEFIRNATTSVIGAVRGAFGNPSSLLRRISSSYRTLEQQNASYRKQLTIEREASHATNTLNHWLTAQLAEATSYAQQVLEEAGNAVQRRDHTITELEARVQDREAEIVGVKKMAEEAEKQHRAAQHWKRDVVEAGQVLLQTRAELEAIRAKKTVVFAADHNDRLTYASPRALKLLGYDARDIYRANVYDLLRGTDKKSRGQVKFAVQTNVMENRPEKISLPNAQLIRSGDRDPIGANLTIIPIYAGTTYIGTVIRGESKEERKARLNAEAVKKEAAEAAEKERIALEVARSKGVIAEQASKVAAWFIKRRDKKPE